MRKTDLEGKLETDFFSLSDAVSISTKKYKEGNYVVNNTMYFSSWAGPDASMWNVIHEMAHFVEIDDARCHRSGWGFVWPEKEIFGQIVCEPKTAQDIQRECRTFAIQIHILERYCPEEVDITYMAELTKWQPGWGNVPKPYIETVKGWIANEYKKWTFESIRQEWIRKLPILEAVLKEGRFNA